MWARELGPLRIVLVALPLIYLVWNALYYHPYIVDDAFISLRYAKNLVDGGGLVYNPGEHVEGFSNFLWVMVGASLLALGVPGVAGLKVFGVVAAVGVAVCLLALGQRVLAADTSRNTTSWLAYTLLCTSTSVALWAQAGLETLLFALLLVATVLALLLAATVLRVEIELGRDDRGLPISALLFALACMTRPEARAYGLFILVRLRRG